LKLRKSLGRAIITKGDQAKLSVPLGPFQETPRGRENSSYICTEWDVHPFDNAKGGR